MVNTKFNFQTGILESKFNGEIYLNEITNYIIATKENNSYPRTLKIISDASNAHFNFQPKDIEVIIYENNRSLERYDYIIDAIIVESPRTTAITILYKELSKNRKYIFNVFSTKEAALEWINNDY